MIRPLSPNFAVSPQLDPEDIPAAAAAGYTTLICNRPDMEVPPSHQAAALRAAAEAAGMQFVDNPIQGGAMTLDNVAMQAKAAGEATGPVLAYCNSGTRSSICWAMAQAGHMEVDAILEATRAAGYELGQMRGQIEAMASYKAGEEE